MNLQLQILASLRRVHPYMMPVDALWAEVRMGSVRPPNRSDFDHALHQLEDKRQIIQRSNDDTCRIKITEDGIARHDEAVN